MLSIKHIYVLPNIEYDHKNKEIAYKREERRRAGKRVERKTFSRIVREREKEESSDSVRSGD